MAPCSPTTKRHQIVVPGTWSWLPSKGAIWAEGRTARAGGPVLGGVDGPAGVLTHRPCTFVSNHQFAYVEALTIRSI